MFSDDDTDSAKSDREYDSERDSDLDMRMEDDVDASDHVDLHGNMDMEWARQDEEDEDEEDEKEEAVVDEDEQEDEDNGKEPRIIGHSEMVNTSADDADTIVDDEPTVLPEHGQEIREHTLGTQSLRPAPPPQTPEAPTQSRHPVAQTLGGLGFVGLVTPEKLSPAAPILRESKPAGNTSKFDVEQHRLSNSAGGDDLPDGPLHDVPLPDVPLATIPLPNVTLPNVPLPDVPLPQACLDGLVSGERSSPRIADEACVSVRVGFLCCDFPLL
jgi:hypothetical protein